MQLALRYGIPHHYPLSWSTLGVHTAVIPIPCDSLASLHLHPALVLVVVVRGSGLGWGERGVEGMAGMCLGAGVAESGW